MMKKRNLLIIAVLMALAVVFSACGNDANNDENSGVNTVVEIEQVENINDFVIDGNVLVSYSGTDENVIIPNGIVVIDENAFAENTTIKSVVIPETVTTVGNNAFGGCTSLVDITVPSSVYNVCYNAFAQTPWYDSLTDEFVLVGDSVLIKYNGTDTEISIPKGVKSVAYAFASNENITKMVMPKGLERICEFAFYGCTNLADVTIPDSVKRIDAFAFHAAKWYGELPKGFNIFGDGVLLRYANTDAETIVIPDGVKQISTAFYYNILLKEVTIPKSVEEISSYAFYGAESIQKINIAEGLKKIGDASFGYCSSLAEIILPSTVESIGYGSFGSCLALKEFYVGKGLTDIGEASFSACGALEKIVVEEGNPS